MTDLVVRPLLSTKVPTADSRTEAFGQQRFGTRSGGIALELRLPEAMNANQLLAAEVLIDLCLRMDPIVAEIRLATSNVTAVQLVESASRRFPLAQNATADASLQTVRFAVGAYDVPYVDVSDWSVGFNAPVPSAQRNFPAGPFLGALEAAKYIFLKAATIAYPATGDHLAWTGPRVFDAWNWRWSSSDDRSSPHVAAQAREVAIALVGCGGVGAGYLWFLRKTSFFGELLLIDDDVIKWHNMNRLPYATIADAAGQRRKVAAAADYMAGSWKVQPVARQAEHDEAFAALKASAARGGLLASAVGEPETRKYLGRRGFQHFFDAGTNSDGWARVLALTPGASKCSECQIQAGPVGQPGRCAEAETEVFAGVVPHLAAYGGVLMALEHSRLLLGAPVLGGANTQSIMMDLEPTTRLPAARCKTCPLLSM